jgi:NAD(P)-dependent dehydrogenase (short-subunit alcohol dehydrogenase family)
VVDLPYPECGDDDVIVKNLYGGCCGTDINAYSKGGDPHMIWKDHKFGHEMVSEVVEVGKNVKVGALMFPNQGSALRDRNRRAIPVMIKSGGGSIVNIGTYAALRGNHGPSYTAAKAGLEGLTKSIAFEYAKQGIRCNIIHPGGMATNIGQNSGGAYHEAGQKLSKIVQSMPVTFYGQPVEIAYTCLFLCGDESKLINGAVLSVDGGMSVC